MSKYILIRDIEFKEQNMVQISRLNILRSLSFKQQAQKSDLSSNEGLLLKQGGIDAVSFSCKKSEKFADVRAEMDKKVPDNDNRRKRACVVIY